MTVTLLEEVRILIRNDAISVRNPLLAVVVLPPTPNQIKSNQILI